MSLSTECPANSTRDIYVYFNNICMRQSLVDEKRNEQFKQHLIQIKYLYGCVVFRI